MSRGLGYREFRTSCILFPAWAVAWAIFMGVGTGHAKSPTNHLNTILAPGTVYLAFENHAATGLLAAASRFLRDADR